jgi:hypothetical protein
MRGGLNMDDNESDRRLYEKIAYIDFMREVKRDREIIQELAERKARGEYYGPPFDEKTEYERLDEAELELIDEAIAKGIFLRPHYKITIEDKDKENDKDD